jgi:cytochrome bd ubiquinol oxidase subunit I
MTDLLAARTQMAVSLAFHIIFASIGIAMPFLMAAAHWKWLKTREPVYLQLTRRWSKGVAIFFAVGAVSGTVLSFELGLLWPKFMEHAGPIIGMPFSWEGAAFFLEAIALGLFLYGWDRLSPWVHWASGAAVGITGVLSGLFVVCANGWMNSPTGFDWLNGKAINIDPWKAMFNEAALGQGVHMTIAAFQATGFAVAGIHAFGLRRNPKSRLHREAMKIALLIGAVAALIQPLSGDLLAKGVAVRQPIKLAAMEALFKTSQPAPFTLGGWPSEKNRTVDFGLHIPFLLSFLAKGDPHAKVLGLEAFPEENWPPIAPVHLAFQIMIAIGTMLALVGAYSIVSVFKNSPRLWSRSFLAFLTAIAPLGFIAMEAGWVVTEVGRQPWIIYEIMRTSEALTPMPGLWVPMLFSLVVYAFLALVVTWLMVRQFKHVD